MIKRNIGVCILLLAALAVITVFSKAKNIITVKGSDTMVILAQRWAEAYMEKNPNSVIQVTGGGSGVGISALINGSTDIANASRSMKNSERDKLKQRYNSLGVEIPTARDGITVYVHETNPIKELNFEQLKGIFTGEITNWKDIGGPDQKIILYGRENSSGTYVYFRDNVLNGMDYAATTQTLPGTAAVVNAVAKDPNGVGYGGVAYASGVKAVAVKKDASSSAYEPTAENITSGNYPISRFLFMYVKTKPTGQLKEYIDWILSKDGQSIVTKVGYFPIN